MNDVAANPPASHAPRATEAKGGLLAIEPGNWVSRVTWAVLFAIPTAVFITAALLTPNPEGHGTHTQLGLPPCGFLVFTNYPCPGCGLTTAFAYMIRFDWIGAWMANPFGIPLFLSVAAFIPFAALGFVKGWGVVAALDRIHAEKFTIALAAMSLVTWLTRCALLAAHG